MCLHNEKGEKSKSKGDHIKVRMVFYAEPQNIFAHALFFDGEIKILKKFAGLPIEIMTINLSSCRPFPPTQIGSLRVFLCQLCTFLFPPLLFPPPRLSPLTSSNFYSSPPFILPKHASPLSKIRSFLPLRPLGLQIFIRPNGRQAPHEYQRVETDAQAGGFLLCRRMATWRWGFTDRVAGLSK